MFDSRSHYLLSGSHLIVFAWPESEMSMYSSQEQLSVRLRVSTRSKVLPVHQLNSQRETRVI